MTRRENVLNTIRRRPVKWIPYRYNSIKMLRSKYISVQPQEGGIDDWGVRWHPARGKDGYSYPDETPALRIDQVGAFGAPDTDWDRVSRDLQEQVASHNREDYLLIGYNELTLFTRAQVLLGTAEFLMATLLEPEKLEILLDSITDYQKLHTRAVMEVGVAGVRFTDDWGMQTGMFISPEQWRRFIKPRVRALYEIVEEYGGIVFQHSCGHIEEIVPDLIEMGCDVLDPAQPSANDIYRWKREYGDRLVFMGGIDTQTFLSFGAPEEVRRETKKVLAAMGEGGGYIAAPSHTIHIPEPNQQAMIEAINAFIGEPEGRITSFH